MKNLLSKKTFKVISLISIILLASVVCSSAKEASNPQVKVKVNASNSKSYQKRRDVEKDFVSKKEFVGRDIVSIEASSSLNVYIHKSPKTNNNYVEIKTAEKYIDYVSATLEGGKLYFTIEKHTKENFFDDMIVNVYIYTTGFSNIDSRGASDVHIMDSFSLNKLELAIRGSSDFIVRSPLSIEKQFNLDASGSSDVIIDEIDVKGGCFVSVSGSSDLVIKNLLSKCPINFTASGSSDAVIAGNVLSDEYSNISVSSSSDFHAANLIIKKLNIDGKSSSESKVNVTENLNISCTNSSSLYYKGNPGLNLNIKNVSTSATVKKY